MTTALAEAIEPPGSRSADGTGRVLSRDSETRFVDPRLDGTWDLLVLKHPEHTFFHSTAWAQVLCLSYGHKPFYLQVYERGELVALLPLLEVNSRFTGRRGVCLPFSDACGPLIFGESVSPLFHSKLVEMARARRWEYVEIRGTAGMEDGHLDNRTFYVHELDLKPGLDQLLRGFDASVRRALRKAGRSELTVQISDTRQSLARFFGLHMKTRRRHGVPPQSKDFFSHIHEAVLKPGLGFVVQACRDSRPIAAAVFFNFGRGAVYKFAASEESQHQLRGNNLVMWEGIKELVNRGAERLHFGRTSCENHGLRRYKRAWASKEESVSYLRLDLPSERWTSVDGCGHSLHEHVFRRMPLAVNRLAGAMLYPHLH